MPHTYIFGPSSANDADLLYILNSLWETVSSNEYEMNETAGHCHKLWCKRELPLKL